MGERTDKERYCRFCGKKIENGNYFFCSEKCMFMFEEEYEDIEALIDGKVSDSWKKYYRAV